MTVLLATCAAIVGTELPNGAGPDSRNVFPALLDEEPAKPVRDFAIHHSLWATFAIRKGPWKLILGRGSGGLSAPEMIDPEKAGGPPGQLYHLQNDLSETENVWESHPDVVQSLSKRLASVRGED